MTVPLHNLTDTWNDGGTTFTAIKMNVTNTASAAGSLLLDLQVGATSQFSVTAAGVVAINSDTVLARDAANILAQRNSTNAQTFRVYNTFTDASNYERGVFDWTTSANTLTIGTQKAGTGSTREIDFVLGGVSHAHLSAEIFSIGANSAATRLDISGKGSLRAEQNTDAVWKLVTANQAGGGTFAYINSTPSTLASGSTNNYALSSGSYFQRLTANASNSVLTGMVSAMSAGMLDGEVHVIINVASSGTLTLNHEDTNSTAANRFLCSTGANIVLSPNQAADVIYDSTVSRWLVFKRN